MSNPQELAQSILDYIEAHPERHNQMHWLKVEDEPDAAHMVTKENICNTTMCVAGTAVFLSRPLSEFRKYNGEWVEDGSELLGLDYEDADRLFHSNNETALKLLEALADGDEDEFARILDEEYEGI